MTGSGTETGSGVGVGDFLDECKVFAAPAWAAFEHHPWIEALFANELDDDRFRFWLAQDLPYLGQHITEAAYAKVPPHKPLVALEREYARRSEAGRVELRLLDEVGPFGKTRWAARPRRAEQGLTSAVPPGSSWSSATVAS